MQNEEFTGDLKVIAKFLRLLIQKSCNFKSNYLFTMEFPKVVKFC